MAPDQQPDRCPAGYEGLGTRVLLASAKDLLRFHTAGPTPTTTFTERSAAACPSSHAGPARVGSTPSVTRSIAADSLPALPGGVIRGTARTRVSPTPLSGYHLIPTLPWQQYRAPLDAQNAGAPRCRRW